MGLAGSRITNTWKQNIKRMVVKDHTEIKANQKILELLEEGKVVPPFEHTRVERRIFKPKMKSPLES